jgi:hypothetical protein
MLVDKTCHPERSEGSMYFVNPTSRIREMLGAQVHGSIVAKVLCMTLRAKS